MTIADYYQSYKNYFWVWEEDANVLSIAGGSTIGFREQVAEILMGIAENGLPSFGSFLLAMIATNKTMDDGVENVAAQIKLLQQQGAIAYSPETTDEAFAFLKLLQNVPHEYTIGRRRQILLQTIFSNCHNRLNVPTSKGLAAGLIREKQSRKKLLTQKEFNAAIFIKDFRALALLLRHFPTVPSIIKAMGDLPELSEAEIPFLKTQSLTQKTYVDFVEELIDNPQTFHTGALIKPIWAGFKVPIFNAHPSEQPLGGVSDLTNKGDFDKLLISEFANDDLVLMHRIANNEALYIQREMPPVKDQLHRTVLIDISLKNWGTPKILAYAAYIAIVRHPKSVTATDAFVVGSKYTPVSCSNMEDTIDGLQKVDAGLHAAKGLAAFLEANKNEKQLELFFITTTDALTYPEVQRQLISHHSLFKYIITTDAEGEINFYRRINNVQKHLQTIRLPLSKLWANKPSAVIKEQQPIIPDYAPEMVPILMPTPMQIARIIPLDEDVYIVANKCLYKRSVENNRKSDKGWQLILRNLPANGFYELGRMKNGEVRLLSFNPQNKEMEITRLNTLQRAKGYFVHWAGKRFPQFLFNGQHQFIYLVRNPDSFRFEPEWGTGNIDIKKQELIGSVFESDYPKRQKDIAEVTMPYVSNILRNVTEVYINDSNYLVFSKHQLSMYGDSEITFSTQIGQRKVIVAIKDNKGRAFIFKDGSKVIVDHSGFIKLVSSNPAIQDIFLIPVMERGLAMATALEFAGNEFYCNSNLGDVNVTIEDTGAAQLSVIKILRQYYGLALREAQEVVHAAPHKIPANIHLDNAVKMIEELKNIGCIATMAEQAQPSQKVISARSFYLQNIATFIGHIINYASSD